MKKEIKEVFQYIGVFIILMIIPFSIDMFFMGILKISISSNISCAVSCALVLLEVIIVISYSLLRDILQEIKNLLIYLIKK